MGDVVPNFSPMMLLHGEQYLEIKKWPLPTSARVLSYAKLLEVVDETASSVFVSGAFPSIGDVGGEYAG